MKNRDFKRVSLSEFKRRLSHWFDEAEAGTTIEVTRHDQPSVRVEGVGSKGLHVGSRVGRKWLGPLYPGRSFPGILKVLAEDRAQDR